MADDSTNKVAKGDVVNVYYTGTLSDGSVFDSNVGKESLEFTVGSGQLIEGFDKGVIGMKLNETKKITIPAKEAYGEPRKELVIKIPKSDFGENEVKEGMGVKTESGEEGIIKEVKGDEITVDFNPPLAGKDLTFEIKVASIDKKAG